MRQLIYIMLITNNHASFHLYWKQNLLIYQIVWNYYEHSCLQNFLLLFMSLLTVLIVKSSHILAGICFIFLKNVADQTWNTFNIKFGPQLKDRERCYWVRQILALFCILVALILGWNCVKGLRYTKIVKKIKFEGVCGKLKSKNCIQGQPFTK